MIRWFVSLIFMIHIYFMMVVIGLLWGPYALLISRRGEGRGQSLQPLCLLVIALDAGFARRSARPDPKW